MRPSPRVLSAIVLAAGLLLGSSLWLVLDIDGDGLLASQEMARGTDPTMADTDRDGLGDGWERSRGLDPRDGDMDDDLVADGIELRVGGDIRSNDTDADGLIDLRETDDVDCNMNGFSAMADADDDSDRRRDGDENAVDRCDPDSDEDRVLDGFERAVACVHAVDCDADGISDAQENSTQFDPADPDTFDVHLSDAVVFAFQESGQAPSGDDDADGIPDAWETSSGLLDWGPFSPVAGQRDLLIEFVRVSGPDSERFDQQDFSSAYRTLQDTFRDEAGIEVDWIETNVHLDREERPPDIPSRLADYYHEVLSHADQAANPYVTTIVLNPQHDQTDAVHLGVAPIRGMLGAVDYGAHTLFHFEGTRTQHVGGKTQVTTVTLSLSPIVEGLIAADRQANIQAMGFREGRILADGDYELVGNEGVLIRWHPFWFHSLPVVEWDDGSTTQLSLEGWDLRDDEMASTIMHEFGHTLGLCHLQLPDCFATLSAEERQDINRSTMGPGHDFSVVHFFQSEWDRVGDYLTCPPDRPLGLIAAGANESDVLDSKYAYELEDILSVDVRRCGDFDEVPGARFAALSNVTRYEAPQELRDPPTVSSSRTTTAVYATGVIFVSGALAFIPRYRRRKTAGT